MKNISMIHRFKENGKEKTKCSSFKTAKKAVESAKFWETSSILEAIEITIINTETGETIYHFEKAQEV